LTEAEKGVILRELGTDWQGNSGFAERWRKANKNPAKGIARAGLERSRRCECAATAFGATA
jgi:hypothetical protein